jgi:hypothetical protein
MSTTVDDLNRWFNKGKKEGATHMIIMCDTFDYDDYTVFVEPSEDVRTKCAEYSQKSMQKIMEVYDLSKTFASQSDGRVMNF